MRKHINTIIVTNLPAFYKIKLYNEIAVNKSILVFYTGATADERNEDFFDDSPVFNYIHLHGSPTSMALSCVKMLFRDYDFDELIIQGWDQVICWVLALCPFKSKKSVVVESSIYESSTDGLKATLKRCFLKFMDRSYVCGIPHRLLVGKLGFRGEIIVTGGCGILNYVPQQPYVPRDKVKHFLYVGRFVEVKNLLTLIRVFNGFPQYMLHLVGFGPLENRLKEKANDNIIFEGAIPNRQLKDVYQKYDVFVLPSLSEPWGLVVEEALNNGMPVIVSDKVGCNVDLVKDTHGIVFNIDDDNGLKEAINRISDITVYNTYRKNISVLDFSKRVEDQINSYFQ